MSKLEEIQERRARLDALRAEEAERQAKAEQEAREARHQAEVDRIEADIAYAEAARAMLDKSKGKSEDVEEKPVDEEALLEKADRVEEAASLEADVTLEPAAQDPAPFHGDAGAADSADDEQEK